MRKLGLVCAATVWLCAVAATPSSAQAPEDSVTGSGMGLTLRGSYDAHSGPSGENPTGTASVGFRATGIQANVGGRVLCLTVSGNRAVIGIDASLESTISGFVGFLVQGALIEVIDGGVQMDSQGFVPLAAPPTACPSTFTAGQDPVLLAFADLVVTDSQPLPSLPTSKEQCKNGGWRNFGVFKNQGDCVSFVAIGGKNPPGGP